MTRYLLNTTVVPCEGVWEVSRIYALQEVRMYLDLGFVSAVGHQSTAEIISQLLGTRFHVPVNRITVEPQVGDILVCFKLKQRPPEGVILSKEQIEELGYEWYSMRLRASSMTTLSGQLAHEAHEAENRRKEAAINARMERRDCMGGHRD